MSGKKKKKYIYIGIGIVIAHNNLNTYSTYIGYQFLSKVQSASRKR